VTADKATVMPAEAIHIAVASRDGKTVAGHIGKCADWIVYAADFGSDSNISIAEIERISLPKHLVFHHYQEDGLHPLGDCSAVIGASAGDSFITKMKARGFDVALTAESDPATAVADYLNRTLAPPKPRPIGSLICKIHDAFS